MEKGFLAVFFGRTAMFNSLIMTVVDKYILFLVDPMASRCYLSLFRIIICRNARWFYSGDACDKKSNHSILNWPLAFLSVALVCVSECKGILSCSDGF